MNMFDYKPESEFSLGRVWSLFHTMTAEDLEVHSYEYSTDIVRSALSGHIDLSKEAVENFNLLGYVATCKKNAKILERKRTEKELFIVDSFSDDESQQISFGDVPDTVLKEIDTMFDEMLDDEAFEQSLNRLLGIRNRYIKDSGVDIVALVKSALSGTKSAFKSVAKYARKDREFKEIMMNLCDSKHSEEVVTRLELLGV